VVCRILGSRAAAEDVTQDVFVKLYTAPPGPPIDNPRAWVFRMARNLAIDALRKKKCTDIGETDLPAEDALGPLVLRWDVEAAMARLSQTEREIISLHLNGDLRFREIASVTGTSVSSVYRTYRRAIASLRNSLNGDCL